jgi:hypothetical protein
MRLTATCHRAPSLTLEVFTPPGHDKLIIQIAGKLPADGIPLVCLGDLVGLLSRYVEEIAKVQPGRFVNPYEEAARQMAGADEQFTPFFVPGNKHYAYFMESVSYCAACKSPMISAHKPERIYNQRSLAAQLKRAGWKHESGVISSAHGGELCHECAAKGLASFKCELCGEVRDNTLIQFQHGDPPDYLCKVCYETVTAQEWEKAEEKIWEAHQWDNG